MFIASWLRGSFSSIVTACLTCVCLACVRARHPKRRPAEAPPKLSVWKRERERERETGCAQLIPNPFCHRPVIPVIGPSPSTPPSPSSLERECDLGEATVDTTADNTSRGSGFSPISSLPILSNPTASGCFLGIIRLTASRGLASPCPPSSCRVPSSGAICECGVMNVQMLGNMRRQVKAGHQGSPGCWMASNMKRVNGRFITSTVTKLVLNAAGDDHGAQTHLGKTDVVDVHF